MVCQQCGQKPATVHLTKIINSQKTEFHICESCAREKGEWIPDTANGFSIHNLLSGLLDFDLMGHKQEGREDAKLQAMRCENCGLSYAQFGKLGRFGCDKCYAFFGDRLDPLLKRVHGNTVHIGKIPKCSGGRIQRRRELEDLKRQLQHSILREEFEEAAKVRDRIRELENQTLGDSKRSSS